MPITRPRRNRRPTFSRPSLDDLPGLNGRSYYVSPLYNFLERSTINSNVFLRNGRIARKPDWANYILTSRGREPREYEGCYNARIFDREAAQSSYLLDLPGISCGKCGHRSFSPDRSKLLKLEIMVCDRCSKAIVNTRKMTKFIVTEFPGGEDTDLGIRIGTSTQRVNFDMPTFRDQQVPNGAIAYPNVFAPDPSDPIRVVADGDSISAWHDLSEDVDEYVEDCNCSRCLGIREERNG